MNEIIRSKLLLKKSETASKKSSVSTSTALEKAKVVGLYFSASYCPPCHKFTPLLKSVYEELSPKGLEIILIPSDKSREDYESYFGDMPWFSLPYDTDIVSNGFASSIRLDFNVTSIPTLIFFDTEGKMITRDGRLFVQRLSVSELSEKLGL